MDTLDRPDSNLPARYSANSFRVPAPIAMPPRDLATTSMPQLTPRLILRGLNRHWWRILLLWLVVSTPLAYLIYVVVEPTYEAFSLLQIEPTTERLFQLSAQSFAEGRAYEPYLQTQVQLITSDVVLDQALSRDARIAKLPMIEESDDPKADLRKQMDVGIVNKNTYLIRVALASGNPEEAALIVNAVVNAYMDQHTEYHRSANKAQHKSLTEELEKLAKEILGKKNELRALVDKGHAQFAPDNLKMNPTKGDDSGARTLLPTVTEEQFTQTSNTLLQIEMKLLEEKAHLKAAEAELERVNLEMTESRTQESAGELSARVEEEFLRDPEVDALAGRIRDAQKELDKVKSLLRRPGDPRGSWPRTRCGN